MPATRGVKRAASKSTTSSAASVPKNKKKRTPFQLEIPTAPKKRGRVLTCGQGDVGQLGLGESILETSKFKHVTALGDKVVDVCAGGMHTVALDCNGKVWTYGCNDEGALGRTTSGEKDEGTPKTVSLPSKAVLVTAGDSHSAALMENGDVYAWGAFRDSHGSMGLVVRGREGKSCKDPVKVDIGETAAAIASGGDHLVILSTTGNVYTMGCGEQGQLGRLTQRSASRESRQGFSALLVPSKVNLKRLIGRIWAGSHATFVLDANTDKVFAFGLNNYGQLGISGEKRRGALYVPAECDAFGAVGARWSSVAVGQHHSLALDHHGQVYAVGRCEYGRLGLGDRTGDAEALEPIPALQDKKCISIATGTSSSFAVTDTGEVWSWGMGSEGQLGTGKCNDEPSPTLATLPQVEGCTARHISGGGQHTVLLVEDPASRKEETPPPEKETEEEKAEEKSEEEIDEEEEEKPKRKRAKKQEKEEEDEVTSTSTDKSKEDAKPQKINGDEKKETPMEVDETDKQEEQKQEDDQTDKPSETTPEQPEDKPDQKLETDTSSQDTQTSLESQTSQEKDEKTEENPDVEMQDTSDKVNGTPEEKIETKSVEGLLQNANPITTTA
ncbi:hypothetical protein K1T71_013809 [Dendrolimus kikuchii]|uniref:Uncharacterized protein n=1 Tax=Dendrolimus kikuchii TaxID=765133 RepID=A0ACC1CFT3_9NEOP|nr:hypothetical protein K1T71_013809 [Dendrolimus kikuchii]